MYKHKVELKKIKKERIRKRIRKKITGTSQRPRIYVFKSNRYIYTQVIDDENGKVLTAASTLEKQLRGKHKNHKSQKISEALGEILSKRLKEKKIKSVIFDRGVYPYHGRIKTLAETVRKGGIVF